MTQNAVGRNVMTRQHLFTKPCHSPHLLIAEIDITAVMARIDNFDTNRMAVQVGYAVPV